LLISGFPEIFIYNLFKFEIYLTIKALSSSSLINLIQINLLILNHNQFNLLNFLMLILRINKVLINLRKGYKNLLSKI
jgi:hypothetical protein